MIYKKEKYKELIIGLTGGQGSCLSEIKSYLEKELNIASYDVEEITISNFFEKIDGYIHGVQAPNHQSCSKKKIKDIFKKNLDKYQKTFWRMQVGSFICKESKCKDILAKLAVLEIKKRRLNRHIQKNERPVAYIIKSLKRVEEVKLLEDLYGRSFILLSVYSPEKHREERLISKFVTGGSSDLFDPKEAAALIIEKDYQETDKNLYNNDGVNYGQNERDCFSKGHYFISEIAPEGVPSQVKRFVHLLFGNPFIPPTTDEFNMFHADGAALRSLDLSRQVGAVITKDMSIVSMGWNDVQKMGSFLDPEKDIQSYDFSKGYELNSRLRKESIDEIVNRIRHEFSDVDKNKIEKIKKIIEKSSFSDVIEYFRSSHAEMAAIIDAARRGSRVIGCDMYVNAFPCHECLKYIIAAGIKTIIYIDPYPKSKAFRMFGDFISIDSECACPDKVNIKPFMGVSPRRYLYVFRKTKQERQNDGKAVHWDLSTAKYPIFLKEKSPRSYYQQEYLHIESLIRDLKTSKLTITPSFIKSINKINLNDYGKKILSGAPISLKNEIIIREPFKNWD